MLWGTECQAALHGHGISLPSTFHKVWGAVLPQLVSCHCGGPGPVLGSSSQSLSAADMSMHVPSSCSAVLTALSFALHWKSFLFK